MTKLLRSFSAPIREELSWREMWEGPDDGLIGCWERGRKTRVADPELAHRAKQGELVTLAWKGGTENIDEPIDGDKKPKSQRRYGSLYYLATWQGIRDEDLTIELDEDQIIVCSRANRRVIFRSSSHKRLVGR
jgi:hypothetical protein